MTADRALITRNCPATGKVKYEKKGTAKNYARESSKRSGTMIRVYRCPHCRSWHLTQAEKRINKPRSPVLWADPPYSKGDEK
jgi:hypothetical protein